MSLLIQPILAGFKTLLSGLTFVDDPPFGEVGFAWTGNLINPPGAWVMPGRTRFPAGGNSGAGRPQTHEVTIRLGIVGSDPNELTARTLRYVQAVDAAIEALPPNFQWGAGIQPLNIFTAEHDYGQIWKTSGTVAFWPDIHVQVEVEELS